MTVRLPTKQNRTVVLGSTGSGKTVFAVALLEKRFDPSRRVFVIDFKGDELIAEIGATEISVKARLPKKPGLYVIRPLPGDEGYVSNLFYQCWASENCLIYIDEGYMVPKNCRWFRACLTQGRAKNIEMIVLSQRPVWMDKFNFTEASFIALFNINYEEDRKHVSAYLGGLRPTLLPKHHCLWFDVDRQEHIVFEPVPKPDILIERFSAKLDRKPRKI